MRRLYLAGPMTGIPERNFPAFHEAAARLRSAGFEVVNPAELNADHQAFGWLVCMRRDIKALVDCDGVATLPGWRNSRGASVEVGLASSLDMPVYEIDALAPAEVDQ